MKLGDQKGCIFDDRIDFDLSPSDVETLINILEDKALNAETYSDQGLDRGMKDKLQDRYDEWKKLRDEKDKKI